MDGSPRHTAAGRRWPPRPWPTSRPTRPSTAVKHMCPALGRAAGLRHRLSDPDSLSKPETDHHPVRGEPSGPRDPEPARTPRHRILGPSYMGDSIAKWEGDTLVVDSRTNFNDEVYLDASHHSPCATKLKRWCSASARSRAATARGGHHRHRPRGVHQALVHPLAHPRPPRRRRGSRPLDLRQAPPLRLPGPTHVGDPSMKPHSLPLSAACSRPRRRRPRRPPRLVGPGRPLRRGDAGHERAVDRSPWPCRRSRRA